jgi:excisionase family DNA binding protein
MDERLLMTTQEIARRLSVSPATVRRWARLGLIPHFRTPSADSRAGSVRYDLDAVLAAMRRQRRETEPHP